MEKQPVMGMFDSLFRRSFVHVFSGFIADLQFSMQTPHVYTSVTTVSIHILHGMGVYLLLVSELVVAAEEVSVLANQFRMCLADCKSQSLNDVKLWSPDTGLVILVQGKSGVLSFKLQLVHNHRTT
jgi:hypothetical protein